MPQLCHAERERGSLLSGIAAELAEQKPSAELAELLKRKKLFEKLGMFSLSIAALVGIMLILSATVNYKLMLLGPELLFGSAIGAVVLFGLLSAFLFMYPKLFMRSDDFQLPTREIEKDLSVPTGKLLEQSHLEPASVTEDSTELLHASRRE